VKGRDGRSLRVALISDAILNAPPGSAGDRLRAGVTEQGWGLVALPPSDLPEEPAAAWLANIADLVREFTHHGLAAVVLFSAEEPRGRRRLVLDTLAATGVAPAAYGDADHGPLVTGVLDDLSRRAAAHTARPPSWKAAGAAGHPVR
jgi:hypothetical protein